MFKLRVPFAFLKFYRSVVRFLVSKGFWRFALFGFYPLRALNNFIIFHVKSRFAEVNGCRLFLDSSDPLGFSTRENWEPFETEIVRRVVKEGNVVLDIGANIGLYTVVLSKLVGENGKVFAFEPCPQTFAILKKNVEFNGCKNVVLVQKAVSDVKGICKLHICDSNAGANSLGLNKLSGPSSFDVERIVLDDFLADYCGKIDFVKMDIEGSEYSALKGMAKILKKSRRLKLFTEFNPPALKGCGASALDYLSLLFDNGFKLYNINEDTGRLDPLDSLDRDLFLGSYPANEPKYTNLFCIK